MSLLFHLHTVSLLPSCLSLPQSIPPKPPCLLCPLIASWLRTLGHSVSWVDYQGHPSGTPPASLLPPNLAALWKSEGGDTLVAGKAFESAKPPVGAGEQEELFFCQVNVQLSWTPEDEGSTETLELGTLTMPPSSLGAT